MKLLLDPKQSRPLYLPAQNVKRDLKNLPKSPAAVAGDFIGAMYRHAMKEISKKVLKSYLDMCTVEYVLSGTSNGLCQCSFLLNRDLSPCCLVRCC